MMHASDRDDLSWLAFRYVVGELTADESEAFELRLADDQQARDAVVVAVQLIETVAEAEVPLSVRQRQAASMPAGGTSSGKRRRSRFLAVVVALVAMLLIGISVRSWNAGMDLQVGSYVPSQFAADAALQERLDLLALWNEWNLEQSFDDESALVENIFDRSTGADNTSGVMTADTVDSAEQEFEVPGWMIAALSPEPASGPEEASDVPVEN